jgi:hypothetical protein
VGVSIARGLIGGIGVVLFVCGLLVIAAAGSGGTLFAILFLIVPGALMIIAALIERLRYRSLASEGLGETHGPGGGEFDAPGPPFQPTDERFLDPTTGVQMRVYVDSRTGDRRYVAEP